VWVVLSVVLVEGFDDEEKGKEEKERKNKNKKIRKECFFEFPCYPTCSIN